MRSLSPIDLHFGGAERAIGVYLVETKLRRYEAAHLTKVKRQAAKLR